MQVRDPLDLLPLRQMVHVRGDASRVFARRGLLAWLSKPERFQIVAHGEGGQLLAASEFALAEARVVLQQAYGERVAFGSVVAHSYVDTREEVLMVPVMFLRIDAPRCFRPDLAALLEDRGAEMKEVDVQRDRVVLRAEVEFARALGLHRQVQELTDGSAHFLSWLQGYRRKLPSGPTIESSLNSRPVWSVAE